MRVDWLIDSAPNAGSPADGGADARVTGVPTGSPTLDYVTKLTYVLGLDGKYRLEERVVLACS
jgi:hypothetical protein